MSETVCTDGRVPDEIRFCNPQPNTIQIDVYFTLLTTSPALTAYTVRSLIMDG